MGGCYATLKKGTFTNIPFDDMSFDYVIDVVSLQHLDMDQSLVAFKEIRRVMRDDGHFFSVRLGDGSTAFLNGRSPDDLLDAVTVDNISNTEFPLNNNGITSFWSPGIANIKYTEAGLKICSLDKSIRTYQNNKYVVEYLLIEAEKHFCSEELKDVRV